MDFSPDSSCHIKAEKLGKILNDEDERICILHSPFPARVAAAVLAGVVEAEGEHEAQHGHAQVEAAVEQHHHQGAGHLLITRGG